MRIVWMLVSCSSVLVWRRITASAFLVPHQTKTIITKALFRQHPTTTMTRLLMTKGGATMESSAATNTNSSSNPLLSDWTTQPFELPPFSEIETKHFSPALEAGMQAHLDDLQAIVDAHHNDNADQKQPTFESVIAAYDRSGHLLNRVSGVYSNLCSSMNTEELQQIQKDFSPILSRHRSKAMTLPGLFELIDQVFKDTCNAADDSSSSPSLNSEQLRLVERIHLDFVRAGAKLSPSAQEELGNLKARLASLRTQFQQNVLTDESEYELNLSSKDLEGCPASLIDASRQAAVERGHTDTEDDHIITLSRSLVEPFLMYCTNRELRKEAFEAWTQRGQLNMEERDNIAIAKEILKLRQRVAELYGYSTFAEYQCVDRMAKTPEAVMNLLETVWEKAKVSADKERQMMEDYLQETGVVWDDGIQPWDWRFVAEQVRKDKYDLDESEIKEYFPLESVRNSLFGVSEKLFGLEYVPRPDIPTYHPDVDLYEVRRKDSKELVSLFLHDNFVRNFKGSGAWMSEYRSQTKNLSPGDSSMQGIPVVSNNNNFAKASSGSATLLSYDGKCSKYCIQTWILRFAHMPSTIITTTRCPDHVP
jgi:peptidyl-dipeptidase Dcp